MIDIEEGEIGPVLTVPELQALLADGPVVVVVGREDRDVMMTLWLRQVGEYGILFTGGAAQHIGFFAFIDGDHLVDDTGKKIIVHKYLGEI